MTESERWLIGWECEDCDDSIGGEHSIWDLAERLRKEHEEETGHTTTVRVVEEKRILPSNGDRMKMGESMLEIAAERSDRIEWICPECQRTGDELNAAKRCPDCDERLREVFPDGGESTRLSEPLEERGFRGVETPLPGDWASNVEMSIQITSKRDVDRRRTYVGRVYDAPADSLELTRVQLLAEAQSDDHVEATRRALEGAEDKADTPSSK